VLGSQLSSGGGARAAVAATHNRRSLRRRFSRTRLLLAGLPQLPQLRAAVGSFRLALAAQPGCGCLPSCLPAAA
jgi:hypothetical protein